MELHSKRGEIEFNLHCLITVGTVFITENIGPKQKALQITKAFISPRVFN